jgi:glycosyltransferase involved in cell wall biosynthesis
VTPTWRRAELLLGRCVPSVRGQGYPDFEHVIISDGPDEDLARRLGLLGAPAIRFAELATHEPASHFGHRARLLGIEMARGDFIAYLDDDDAWRPDHLMTAMTALLGSDAAFACTSAMLHRPPAAPVRVGDGPLARGRCLPACCMVHRREVLDIATWQDEAGAPDWELVRRWREGGAGYVSVNVVTADYYPGSADFTPGIPVAWRPLPESLIT